MLSKNSWEAPKEISQDPFSLMTEQGGYSIEDRILVINLGDGIRMVQF